MLLSRFLELAKARPQVGELLWPRKVVRSDKPQQDLNDALEMSNCQFSCQIYWLWWKTRTASEARQEKSCLALPPACPLSKFPEKRRPRQNTNEEVSFRLLVASKIHRISLVKTQHIVPSTSRPLRRFVSLS